MRNSLVNLLYIIVLISVLIALCYFTSLHYHELFYSESQCHVLIAAQFNSQERTVSATLEASFVEPGRDDPAPVPELLSTSAYPSTYSPQPSNLLTPADPTGTYLHSDAILSNIIKRYNDIPDLNNIPSTPPPIVDRYLSQRGGTRLTELTHGKWFVFFRGPRTGEIELVCGQDANGNNITYKFTLPTDEELLAYVKMLDDAADTFLKSLKLSFYDNPFDRKLYIYFTGTGTVAPPDICGGAPDSNHGALGVFNDFGAMIHELGHAVFPRMEMAEWNTVFNTFYEPNHPGVFSPVMAGETFANFFGWYVHLLMYQQNASNPAFIKYTLPSKRAYTIWTGKISHWLINSHLAFDGGLYVRFSNPEINALIDAVQEARRRQDRDGTNAFPAILALITKIEEVYGSRYENGYFIYYIYRKYGVESVVAYYYNVMKHKDVLTTLAYVLGVTPLQFMTGYVLDLITQAYLEGDILESINGQQIPVKIPFSYTLPQPRRIQQPFEWKGFDVYDLRSYMSSAPIVNGQTVLNITWTVERYPDEWNVLVYNGYGRNGYFKIDGRNVQMSSSSGNHIVVSGTQGRLQISNIIDGPIFLAFVSGPGKKDGVQPVTPRFNVTIGSIAIGSSPSRLDVIDVWITAGQSNGVGENGDDGSSVSSIPLARPRPGRIIQYAMFSSFQLENFMDNLKYRAYNGDWFDAVANITNKSQGAPNLNAVGPDMAFANTLLDQNASATIGFIPTAWGGSAIQSWLPGQDSTSPADYYKIMVETVNRAMAKLSAENRVARLQGLIWVQGESDAQHAPLHGQYNNRLTAFVEGFRQDFRKYNECLPMILIVQDDSPSRKVMFPYLTEIRTIQQNFNLPNVIKVDMKNNYEYYGTADIHLTKRGASALGAIMARTYLSERTNIRSSCSP